MDAKALPEDLESIGFTASLAKPEIRKEVWRQPTNKKAGQKELGLLLGKIERPQRGKAGYEKKRGSR